MKKRLFLFLLLIFSIFFKAQNSNSIKSIFEGKWERVQKFQKLKLEINFQKNKDIAIVKDIGTGIAPPIIFKANLKDKKLVILPIQNQNDFTIEMEVVNGKLHFRETLVTWDKKGNPIETKESIKKEYIFKRKKK